MQICRARPSPQSVPVKQVGLDMSSECQRRAARALQFERQLADISRCVGRKPQNSSCPVLSSSLIETLGSRLSFLEHSPIQGLCHVLCFGGDGQWSGRHWHQIRTLRRVEVQSGGSIFVHCERNAATVAAIRSNHDAGWTKGAEICSRGVADTNIHKVDYGGHGRVREGCVPHHGYSTAPIYMYINWKHRNSSSAH